MATNYEDLNLQEKYLFNEIENIFLTRQVNQNSFVKVCYCIANKYKRKK